MLGYQIISSCDISKKAQDSDTMFFVRTGLPQPPVARVAVMLAMTDTIRLISGPPELQQVFQAAVQSGCWSKPAQKIEQYCKLQYKCQHFFEYFLLKMQKTTEIFPRKR